MPSETGLLLFFSTCSGDAEKAAEKSKKREKGALYHVAPSVF